MADASVQMAQPAQALVALDPQQVPRIGHISDLPGTPDPRWVRLLGCVSYGMHSVIDAADFEFLPLSLQLGRPAIVGYPRYYKWPERGSVVMIPWREDWEPLVAPPLTEENAASLALAPAEDNRGGALTKPMFEIMDRPPEDTQTAQIDRDATVDFIAELIAAGMTPQDVIALKGAVKSEVTAEKAEPVSSPLSEPEPEVSDVPQQIACPFCEYVTEEGKQRPQQALNMHIRGKHPETISGPSSTEGE